MESTTNIDIFDISFNRLLLAKQLYLHALDHKNKLDAINKMIAIHNFHNAIEIILKAIILQYDIRSEKELNIAFEVMLNEIDKHEQFKDKNLKLPYRQELWRLNQWRNNVQHHTSEPPSSEMDEWKVFTLNFMKKVCQDYFEMEFDDLSPLTLIQDEGLKYLLIKSQLNFQKQNYRKSATLVKIAFELASKSIIDFLPNERLLHSDHITARLGKKFEELRNTIKALAEKSRNAEYFVAILSSGVNLVDYKKFEKWTPVVEFYPDDIIDISWKANVPDETTTQWIFDFVVGTIIKWQTLGLSPVLPEWSDDYVKKIFDESDFIND